MTKSGYFVIPFLGAKKAAPLREDAARRKNLQLKRSDVSRHGEKYLLNGYDGFLMFSMSSVTSILLPSST